MQRQGRPQLRGGFPVVAVPVASFVALALGSGPAARTGDGGGDGQPTGRLPSRLGPPAMRLPSELLPQQEPAEPAEPFVATPGTGPAEFELPLAPITMPIIVAPPPVVGPAPRPAPPEQLPATARGAQSEPPAGRLSSADIGSNVTVPPASYRVGYTDYLRTAGIISSRGTGRPRTRGHRRTHR